MFKTLQTLRPLINLELKNLTLEDISEKYRASLNPSLLALAFDKMYLLFISTSQNYYGLTSEDVASYALQELDFCLKTFNPGNNTFTTYCIKVFKNRLREETTANNMQKRKANQCCTNFEDISQFMYETDKEIDYIELVSTLDTLNLTEREREYCDYLMQGWKTKDILDKMNVSAVRVCHIKKQLKKKLITLVN